MGSNELALEQQQQKGRYSEETGELTGAELGDPIAVQKGKTREKTEPT